MPRSDQKVTPEQVAALAAEGRTASEIAAAVGLSRQRVYAIADKAEIALPPGFTRARADRAFLQTVTGGIPNGHALGAAAEMLAAADLAARGWQVFMPVRPGTADHDLIACKGGMVRTLAVKHRSAKPPPISDHVAIVTRGAPVSYEPPLPGDEKMSSDSK